MTLNQCGKYLLSGLVVLASAVAGEGPTVAQEQPVAAVAKNVYQPAGAPADPKVAVRWNKYHDYAEATELMQQMAKTFPDKCRLESLGKSIGKREMWVLTITSKQGIEAEKAGFWIDGAIHANEIQASEVALYTAWYLLESYDHSPLVKRLVDERVFYILPMMSPDSRDAHMHEANSTHSPRTGQRPRDDDNDGLVDEDGPDDLNGDGHITQMRIKDPNGRHKPHPDFPNLMIQVKPDEKGMYTLLDTEGFDNDGDGKVDEDGPGYYDPNRNWPWNWQPEMVQHGADRYPFSIDEDRLPAEFIMAHPNIASAQSYHNAGGMILRGPGVKTDHYEGPDLAVFTEIAKKGEMMLPGYRYMDTGHELYEVFGGEIDWFYAMQGVFCYTNELFTPQNFFHKASEGGYFGKAEDQQNFNKYLLLGDGIVPWQEVDHPQFGKVEVGGFRKNWLRQPPSFMLEEECHRNMAFSLYHADQMPKVQIDAVDVKRLSDGLFQVTATITNPKLSPSRAAVDARHKLNAPDRVTLAGEGLKVATAMVADNLLFENPHEQKRHAAQVELDSVPGMRAVYVRWVVASPGPYSVTIRSVKGGVATKRSE